MTTHTELSIAVTAEAVEAIASDIFETMVDGEPGHVTPWFGGEPSFTDPRYTWVDVRGGVVARVLLVTGRETGERITRALLGLPEDAEVEDADLVDAAGELVNVVGGNVKSLVIDGGALTLPTVAHEAPQTEGAAQIFETVMGWRGAPVSVSLWTLP